MAAVSVIIITRNRPHDLSACLKSLKAQSVRPSQTVVIDQSGGTARDAVRTLAGADGAEYRHLPKPNGTSRSRNFGIGMARGELVLFLDDDVELEPDYVENMVRFFKTHARAVGMTGVITNLYGFGPGAWLLKLAYKIAGSVFLIDTPHPDGYEITPAFEVSSCLSEPKKERRAGELWGANMCLRAGIFKKERFDGRLGGYAWREDMDFSIRAKRHGELWLVPQCRLVHKESGAGRPPLLKVQRVKEVYQYYLVCKNGGGGALAKAGYWYSRMGVFAYHCILAVIRNYPIGGYARALAYVARNASAIERGETEDFLKPDV